MKTFKVATWNVNSLRVRLPHVLDWLGEIKPDVLALQEIKLVDADFPEAAIREAGYSSVYAGQKTYNGVAILSRVEATEPVRDLTGMDDPQRRVLAATVGDTRIVNIYVPNGESVDSPKYQYKLMWLEKLRDDLQAQLLKYPRVIVLGDFNIAPQSLDVHDPSLWEGRVLFSEPERSAFQTLLQLGFQDCFRSLHPEERQYSWWDYRLNAFKRKLGLRIDHILASQALMPDCVSSFVDQKPRGLDRPSDHTPVVAEFNTEPRP
ncbi:MAG TPA: exodeoxyribonuclease III [Gammaproteobacteria bacterium]|nr:exodeoxyribonuclease III [Gammaproteobacteria bacterium]